MVNQDVADLILDVVHLASETIQADINLPDSPSFCEAMAGPEHNKWHSAILEELAAIKDAGTWNLINPSTTI